MSVARLALPRILIRLALRGPPSWPPFRWDTTEKGGCRGRMHDCIQVKGRAIRVEALVLVPWMQ